MAQRDAKVKESTRTITFVTDSVKLTARGDSPLTQPGREEVRELFDRALPASINEFAWAIGQRHRDAAGIRGNRFRPRSMPLLGSAEFLSEDMKYVVLYDGKEVLLKEYEPNLIILGETINQFLAGLGDKSFVYGDRLSLMSIAMTLDLPNPLEHIIFPSTAYTLYVGPNGVRRIDRIQYLQ